MKRMRLAYSGPEFWRQPVAKMKADGRREFVRQLVAEIPWGHHLLIINKLADPAERVRTQ